MAGACCLAECYTAHGRGSHIAVLQLAVAPTRHLAVSSGVWGRAGVGAMHGVRRRARLLMELHACAYVSFAWRSVCQDAVMV
jgi:hypothetical protein